MYYFLAGWTIGVVMALSPILLIGMGNERERAKRARRIVCFKRAA